MEPTIELISSLIGFDTTSDRSNLPLIDFVADYLADLGIEAHLVPSEDGQKASLFATIGPMLPGGVILSGHTDTVPVSGQVWQSNPYRAVVRDGRLYGRGAVDMKGFIGVCLAMVPVFLDSQLSRPIHLALSYDEETSCRGCLPLIDRMKAVLPPVEAVIVGEPTSCSVVSAHKGVYSWRTRVTGAPAHSSNPSLGVSAISYAARLVGELDRIADTLMSSSTRNCLFDPPYSTMHVSCLTGGNAPNIVARDAELHWELRNLPEDDPLAILEEYRNFSSELAQEMRERSPQCAVVTEEDYPPIPAFKLQQNNSAETLAWRLAGQEERRAVGFCSEAGWFQERGFPTVVWGPGAVDQAHKADEYITLDELDKYRTMLFRLASELRGAEG
ncbi:acetylornithine deacetylase [Vreelandella zhaodongensis]|uniref:Acetylornithine deacetylase n=1 Tax=Vreelandella zhaodongensis TaxID=1176240 RepID=A0ABX2SQW6_VREZH|nr:acetylornithine deacetylase [Halomonas zhaodongensis]NYS44496.1 acetylornithine deacetylase [Halomonas zhaodongensis]